ncbi:methyltransferase [Sphingobacterium sp. DK4209]|uniref:Methyltransferase n=1 Tax=Sphingobacterium zhuxiongii TaxID=2662364 RepID=A0A5Q0Q9B2_9SPHI|nr:MULTISPECIES: SAM-dependent methyltransferase [unclassified Sphingobacterium]MVZ65067.1 methyltransferase [Sphingobacterium sp. DK4209]QGA26016.1 methyltransferase [Sphingobacterium sp. dk4302]
MAIYQDFIELLKESIKDRKLVKLTLSQYRGQEIGLKNLYVKLVEIKRELKMSFVYRYETRDITKNFSLREGFDVLVEAVHFKGFRSVVLQSIDEQLEMQMNKKAEWAGSKKVLSESKELNLNHDKQKERKLQDASKSYLHDLKLTDSAGQVYKNAQDKWKQINHYIEILSSSLNNLPNDQSLRIVDMGAGKGYLTFALYDYLQSTLKRDVSVVGVEFRQDLVELCNRIAERAGFQQLHFEEGTIENYQANKKIDVLIALHACDTATDDAIYKGIQDEASLIVVAPCCHKQVRRELERVKVKNDLDFMTQYGVFMERHAEMLTDSIRALILNYYGYETKVMQFISDQHTPKNVMIVAERKTVSTEQQLIILEKLARLKDYYGLGYQHLERLCQLNAEVSK